MTASTSNGEVAEAHEAGKPAPTRAANAEDLRLALRAATLYYLDGLTQAEIAARLGVSRPTAGRLIARAKAHGLVRIEATVDGSAYSGAGSRIAVACNTSESRVRMNSAPV